MSTSPGKRGGLTALEYAKSIFPRFGGEIIESFSFPSLFNDRLLWNYLFPKGPFLPCFPEYQAVQDNEYNCSYNGMGI